MIVDEDTRPQDDRESLELRIAHLSILLELHHRQSQAERRHFEGRFDRLRAGQVKLARLIDSYRRDPARPRPSSRTAAGLAGYGGLTGEASVAQPPHNFPKGSTRDGE